MVRNLLTALVSAVMLTAATLAGAAPAGAAPPPLSGGMRITGSDGMGCSVAFADPISTRRIYTAAHCYTPGAAREVSLGRYRIGKYRPDLVYDTKLDLVAIQLYEGVTSDYAQCTYTLCYPLGSPRVPQVGDYVCKFGASTRETCGPVLNVWKDEFAVKLPARHGDSGSPIYQLDADGTMHLVGMVNSINRRDRSIAYGTHITRIAELLQNTWGSGWRMY